MIPLPSAYPRYICDMRRPHYDKHPVKYVLEEAFNPDYEHLYQQQVDFTQ